MASIKPEELTICILAKMNRISIHKSIIRALNNPEYICLRVNEDMSSIAMMPCKSTDLMSFRVPDGLLESKRAEMRIFSKPFVQSVLIRNNLDTEGTYYLYGKFHENRNAILFSFSEEDIIKKERLDIPSSIS